MEIQVIGMYRFTNFMLAIAAAVIACGFIQSINALALAFFVCLLFSASFGVQWKVPSVIMFDEMTADGRGQRTADLDPDEVQRYDQTLGRKSWSSFFLWLGIAIVLGKLLPSPADIASGVAALKATAIGSRLWGLLAVVSVVAGFYCLRLACNPRKIVGQRHPDRVRQRQNQRGFLLLVPVLWALAIALASA